MFKDTLFAASVVLGMSIVDYLLCLKIQATTNSINSINRVVCPEHDGLKKLTGRQWIGICVLFFVASIIMVWSILH